MEWISHRGESADAPENTLEAFRLARERRTDGSECDVHFTHDGKLVVCHDNTTERMGDRNVEVEVTDSAALRKISVSGRFQAKYGDTHIPFFAEALQEIGPGRKFYIELKNGTPALADAVRTELASGPLTAEQTVIISFSFGTCEYAKKIMPQYRVLWLTGGAEFSASELACKVKNAGLDGIDLRSDSLLASPEAVRTMHDAGVYVAVWTVDDAADARRLIAAGVDAITSNRAAAVRQEIQE